MDVEKNLRRNLMSKFILSCETTADLTAERFAERNVNIVVSHFFVNNTEYADDFGKTMPYKKLYEEMDKGAKTSTSQVTSEEYVKNFTPLLEEGYDIVHITLSSGLSGTYQSALIAKKELEEKFADRKIYIIDSLGASSGYGLLVEQAADYKDAGHTAEETAKYADELKGRISYLFFSTDLSAYIRGGRVSAASGIIGTLLHVCPLLHTDNEGKLIVIKKLIGKKRATAELIKLMLEHVLDGEDYDGRCYLCNSDCIDDANYVVGELEKTFPKLKGKCEIYDIGATIGCHTGRGTVAVFFVGKERA